LAARPDRFLRAVEAVEELPLREARRLGRVEVLRLLVAERPRAEAEDLAARVTDLHGETVPEAVVDTPRLRVLRQEAGRDEELLGELRERALQSLPAVGRRPEAVGLRVRDREPALLEDAPYGGVARELGAEEARRGDERLR